MRVSVICPVWNRPDIVLRALRSLSQQSFRDFEIIVVDDGSVPPLHLDRDLCEGVAVRVIRSCRNRGPAAARNIGVAAAQGDWLAFLDSDDEWYPTKLERQLAFAEQHTDRNRTQAFVTGFERKDYDLRSAFLCIPRGANAPAEFASGCWFCPGTTLLLRRETFLSVGGFDERLSRLEDYEFFLRFGFAGGTLVVLPDILARIHGESALDLHGVERSADLIVDTYKKKAPTRLVNRLIESFCQLAKASAYYRHRRMAPMLWCLSRSWSLVPRLSVQLIDRFASIEKRSLDLE